MQTAESCNLLSARGRQLYYTSPVFSQHERRSVSEPWTAAAKRPRPLPFLSLNHDARRSPGETAEGGLPEKNATPESSQRWRAGPSRSVCQVADIGMRGLFIGGVRRRTFGGHLVWYSSVSPSLSSPLLPNDAQKYGRATSERRERASIHDQSRVKNKLQTVLKTHRQIFLIVCLFVCFCFSSKSSNMRMTVICWF